MFCEKLFTFHAFPCQALPTGCAGQQREIITTRKTGGLL